MIDEVLLIIDQKAYEKYNEYYFKIHPKRRVKPLKKWIPPSLNEWSRMNEFNCNELKQKWKDFIIWLVNEYYGIDFYIDNYCHVYYTYYFKTKARHDSDNYNGKFIQDGLVASGLLKDDDFEHLKLTIDGFYDNKNPRVEILIRKAKRKIDN